MSTNQAKGDPSESQLKKAGRGGAAVYRAAPSAKAGGAGGPGPSASPPPQTNPVPNYPAQSRGNAGGRRKPNGHNNWHASNVGNGEAAHHQPSNRQQVPAPSPAARRGVHNNGSVVKQPEPPLDAARAVQPPLTFQFGSVNPAYGVQIPPRTTSAPPNLDEQKREQAQYEAAARAMLPVLSHVEPHLMPSQGPVRALHMVPPQTMQQPVHPHAIPGFTPGGKFQPPVMAPQVGQMVSHPVVPPVVPPGPYPFIAPRSNKAIKIVNPETQEEVKFDSKSNRIETASDSRPAPVLSGPLGRGVGPHSYAPNQLTVNHNYAPPFYPPSVAESQQRSVYGYGRGTAPPTAQRPGSATSSATEAAAAPADVSTPGRLTTIETPEKLENGAHEATTVSKPAAVPVDSPVVVDDPKAVTDDNADLPQEPVSVQNSGTEPVSTISDSSEGNEEKPAAVETANRLIEASAASAEVVASSEQSGGRDSDQTQADTSATESEKPSEIVEDGILAGKSSPADLRQHAADKTIEVKSASSNKKKNKKKFLQKADAAGTTSDLYNAYKAPEENKQDDAKSVEKQEVSAAEIEETASTLEQEVPASKEEVDDWEEAADLPTPSPQEKDDHHKRYTRDFLLTFRDQHTEIPFGFEANPEIADCLVDPGIARPAAQARRGGPPTPSRHQDVRLDLQMGGFRPGGPGMMSPGMRFPPSPMVPHMRGVDADRWVHASKGLIPSPHPSLPAMHKAEKKYEIGKIGDEEQVKQRQINAILNKLTPQNFEKLFLQVKDVGIETASTLTGVISQIFDKAVTEPTFCETYARFCVQLSVALPEFNGEGQKVTFKRVLLNKCQEEFERGKREEEEAGRNDEDDADKKEEKRVKARRRMLGNIRFIGELYKNSMLTERIMHDCITALLGEYQNPEEEDVEALCKLMTTIGHLIDHTKAKAHMDAYFARILELSNNQKLPSRLRFGLKDVIDLRKNGWQQRRKVEGPKKIEEVHRDAAQERAQSSRDNRISRGASMGRRMPPSPGPMTPMGGPRNRMHQDVRMDDHAFDRSMPMPMPLQRGASEDITLGPQGGLGRRGPFSARSALGEVPPKQVDYSKRPGTAPGMDRGSYSGRDGPFSAERPLLDRPTTAERREPRLERSSSDNRLVNYTAERPVTPPTPAPPPVLTDEQFTRKSDLTIQEYYSARDMKEAAQCIEELRRPELHGTMVSRWVSGSLERKDVDREHLVKLLLHLRSVDPPLLTSEHMMDGFSSALTTLEDTIIDVPKAPDYLGSMIGKLVSENIFGLAQAHKIVKEGGPEKESLIESGDAFNIFASVLDAIRKEKGEEEMLREYKSSAVQIQDFVHNPPPGELEKVLRRKNLVCLDPMLPAEAYLKDALASNHSTADIIKWLEANSSSLFLEASFLRMVMTEVLNHSVDPRPNSNYKGRTRKYSTLLKRLTKGNSKVQAASQREYIQAVQLFAHLHGHPPGLMTALFEDLYEDEVISEPAFFQWNDDVHDTTPGRAQALREVNKWFTWLAEAPEAPEED